MQTVAILLSLRTIEDWLDPLGISLQAFSNEMLGSWVFGYVRSLQIAGVRTVLFCISNRVAKVTRITHGPTGVVICILPASRISKCLDRNFSTSQFATEMQASNVNVMTKAWRGVRKFLGRVFGYMRTPVLSLALELIRERCVALIVQEYETPRFDVCVLMGRLLKISTYGCFQYEINTTQWKVNPLRFLSMRFCSGLIIATEHELQRVKNQYGPARLAQIPNPIDLKIWYPTSRTEGRKKLGIPDSAHVLVWHGQVEFRKGIDLLIEAWEQLCSMRPKMDLRLLMVGTGSFSSKLQSVLKQKQLSGIVWINKWIHDPFIIRQYLGCGDVFIFPSRGEGFPVAPIEAMACGLPVVASNASGVVDILEGGEASGGIVVPRGDAAALAAAVSRLLDDPALLRVLGNRAKCRAEKSFSLEEIGQRLSGFLLNSQPKVLSA